MNRFRTISQCVSRVALGALAAAAFTGCSMYESSHVLMPEPAVSLNAVASADGWDVYEPFSLVAADSVGLITFGAEIARWDELVAQDRFAEAH